MSYSLYLDFEQPLIELENRIKELKEILLIQNSDNVIKSQSYQELKDELKVLEKRVVELEKSIYTNLTEWQRVQISRHPLRPYTLDYIQNIFSDFVELCGDRNFADDQAIIGGMASFEQQTVFIIGHQKGRTTEEKIRRNFGMPKPEGYRKALRLMCLAERLNKPIITFLDTPGAFPGIDAEERGQSEAIAKNLYVMSKLKVPIISIVIGEGGSGGALGIGVADRLLMLEFSIYSVISPEGCAAILLRDASKAKDIVNYMKITAHNLFELKIVDEIIKEPLGGAHRNVNKMCNNIKSAIKKHLTDLQSLSKKELLRQRYEKYMNIGIFED